MKISKELLILFYYVGKGKEQKVVGFICLYLFLSVTAVLAFYAVYIASFTWNK